MPPALRFIAIIFLSLLPLPIGYVCGAFATRYELTQCYGRVLNGVLTETKEMARSPATFDAQFARFIRTLPLYGSNTDCEQLQSVVETFHPSLLATNPPPALPTTPQSNPGDTGALP